MLHGDNLTHLGATVQHATAQPLPKDTPGTAKCPRMPRKDYVDTKTRMRVAGWLKLIMRERNFPSAAALARHLGVNRSTVGRALRADRLGFDLVLAVHRKLHVDANQLLDQDPLPNGSIPGPQGLISGSRGGRRS